MTNHRAKAAPGPKIYEYCDPTTRKVRKERILSRQDKNLCFESGAIKTIDATPSAAWPTARFLWSNIGDAKRETRRRILLHMLLTCTLRGEPPPLLLTIWLAREIGEPKPRPDDTEMRAAATYEARKPDATLRLG